MKQFVRSHKLVWNLGFWILFFVLVASMDTVENLRCGQIFYFFYWNASDCQSYLFS